MSTLASISGSSPAPTVAVITYSGGYSPVPGASTTVTVKDSSNTVVWTTTYTQNPYVDDSTHTYTLSGLTSGATYSLKIVSPSSTATGSVTTVSVTTVSTQSGANVTSAFNIAPFFAYPNGYITDPNTGTNSAGVLTGAGINIGWSHPLTAGWDTFVLVRNTSAFPVTPDDGVVVHKYNASDTVSSINIPISLYSQNGYYVTITPASMDGIQLGSSITVANLATSANGTYAVVSLTNTDVSYYSSSAATVSVTSAPSTATVSLASTSRSILDTGAIPQYEYVNNHWISTSGNISGVISMQFGSSDPLGNNIYYVCDNEFYPGKVVNISGLSNPAYNITGAVVTGSNPGSSVRGFMVNASTSVSGLTTDTMTGVASSIGPATAFTEGQQYYYAAFLKLSTYSITSATRTSGSYLVTITAANNTFRVGDSVAISGVDSSIPSPATVVSVSGSSFTVYSTANTTLSKTSGTVAYYGIPTWKKVGEAGATFVKDYGTANAMYNMLPAPYRRVAGDSALDSQGRNAGLFSFLKIFAFEHDFLKTLTDNIRSRYDVNNLSGALIPAMLDQFGVTQETGLGLGQSRRMLRNFSAIHKMKGSSYGIKLALKSYTGYNCVLGNSANLMLSVNDSSFTSSVGNWSATTNCSISSVSAASETLTAVDGTAILKVVPAASGNVVTTCGTSITRMVPVTAGASYLFSAYVRSKTSARSVQLSVGWYSATGALLSTYSGSTTTSSTSAWTRMNSGTATAPTNAFFAAPIIKVSSTSSSADIHYVDAVQFEVGTSASTYAAARNMNIVLQPNRANLLINPSLTDNPQYGSAGTYDTPTGWSLDVETYDSMYGAPYLITYNYPTKLDNDLLNYNNRKAITSVGNVHSATFSIRPSSSVAVTPGAAYTWTVYAQPIAGGSSSASNDGELHIKWYDSSNSLISTSSGTAYSKLVTNAMYYVNSFLGTNAPGPAQRMSLVGTAPSNAAYAVPSIRVVQWNIGYIYGASFESVSSFRTYLDGTFSNILQSDDVIWSGSARTSQSYYYKNYTLTKSRVPSIISSYIPLGAPYTITYSS